MSPLKLLFATAAGVSVMAVAPATAPAKDPGERMVCKRDAKTGTRFKKSTCRTKAEWDQIAEQNKRDFQEQQNRPLVSIEKGN